MEIDFLIILFLLVISVVFILALLDNIRTQLGCINKRLNFLEERLGNLNDKFDRAKIIYNQIQKLNNENRDSNKA